MSNERDVERWLRQQVFRDRTTPLERFVLRHAGPGSKGQEVEEFQVPPDFNGDQVPFLRDEILGRAQADADGLGGKLQRYVLVALEQGAKSGPRHPFRVRGEGEEDDGDGEEAPTERGMLAQMMRHNEALMRMATLGANTTIGQLSRQLEAAGSTIERLSAQRQEALATIERATNDGHERDMQMLLTSGQEDRKNAMFKRFEALIPLVVNKFAGKPVLTEEEHSVLGAFVETLSEEQLRGIAQQLSPEQQLSLMTLYKAVREKAAAASQKQNGVH